MQLNDRRFPGQNPEEEIPEIDSDCGVQGGKLETWVKYVKVKSRVTSASILFTVLYTETIQL
jgi:hypothetical protein